MAAMIADFRKIASGIFFLPHLEAVRPFDFAREISIAAAEKSQSCQRASVQHGNDIELILLGQLIGLAPAESDGRRRRSLRFRRCPVRTETERLCATAAYVAKSQQRTPRFVGTGALTFIKRAL